MKRPLSRRLWLHLSLPTPMVNDPSPHDASPLRPVLDEPGRWRCTSRVHELAARGENPDRHRQESASAPAHRAQIPADANVCGTLLPSLSLSCRTLPGLSGRARASRRGDDQDPVARITRARLLRELQKCVGLCAQLASSIRHDPSVFFCCGGCNAPGGTGHPNAEAS